MNFMQVSTKGEEVEVDGGSYQVGLDYALISSEPFDGIILITLLSAEAALVLWFVRSHSGISSSIILVSPVLPT